MRDNHETGGIMKIIIRASVDREDQRREIMEIDGKEVLRVRALHDCPEDASIERDLVSCTDVAEFMKQAHEAGRNGVPLEVTEGEWIE